ncbi:hypothetical protein ILUMI_05134 [Ignelater luminosus]|uniref:1-acylglycerol-3-phosphate O-acyltransferase n=1 Tax=Ignelater luminosus TaxID=2038154 RepID=A0A8K0GKF5_IGNLU|nr:hypothetical protein ILUMI_05134 [Ignelater luminosus]
MQLLKLQNRKRQNYGCFLKVQDVTRARYMHSKRGAFHMAISAQLPILPVVYSRYYFLDKKERRFDHGKIIMTTLPPIHTTGMTVNDIDKLMQQTRDVMIPVFQESNKEVLESVGIIPPPTTG